MDDPKGIEGEEEAIQKNNWKINKRRALCK